MPIISTPPPVTLTPEQLAAQEVTLAITTLINESNNLATCIKMVRAAGAKALYGKGAKHADAVFTALGKEGLALYIEDVRLRTIQEAHEAGSGLSPVPSNLDVYPILEDGTPTEDFSLAVRLKCVEKA